MFPRFPYWCARLCSTILILVLASACSAVDITSVLGSDATPTADPTLLAVPAMLTQTAASALAARLATPTPTLTSTPSPEPTIQIPETGSREAPAAPGQRIQAGPYALFVLPPKLVDAVGTQKAAKGRAYLDVHAVLQNTGSGLSPYSALFFHLSDLSAAKNNAAASQGMLQPLPLNSPQAPGLLSGDLAPGESVRGHLFFDVPEKGGSYAVYFDPVFGMDGGADSVAVWVDLTQPGSSDGLPSFEIGGNLVGLGRRVEKSGEALTVQSISVRQTYGRYKAANGNIFVELNVIIENASLTFIPYNGDYFRIKDSLGYEYPPTVIPSETLLLAGSLTQGRQVSGHVIFEIPASVKNLVVSYQPLVIGQNYEAIRVRVELPATR